MQVGGAVGLAITGVVADQVTIKEARKLGIDFDPRDSNTAIPPPAAALKGYRAAQWTCFAFCMVCEYSSTNLTEARSVLTLSPAALLLVLTFLRGIGRVGHSGDPKHDNVPDESTEITKEKSPMEVEATPRTSGETVTDPPNRRSVAEEEKS